MDLLDSILNGMEKPPSVQKPVIKDKEKREKLEKIRKERAEADKKHKEMLNKFRADFTKRLMSFVNTPNTDDPKTTKWTLKPMNQFFRTIVRESCEDHDDELVVHSFGTEDIDRHCVIWKRGFEPCEEEIRAMKLGVEYKPQKPEDDTDEHDEEDKSHDSKTGDGKDRFWAKYEKIIGENASGIESARKALPAKQYGCVPIEHKKDSRSIEQITDDIRKNKKQRMESETSREQASTSTCKIEKETVDPRSREQES